MQEKINITQQPGFTLIEIMITIIIGGVLMAIALPNFTNMSRNSCLTVKANSFVNSLQFARSEAIKQNSPITLNASNAGDNTNEWGTGWRIVDSTAVDIRLVDLDCGTTTLNETMTNDTSITYTSDGFIDAVGRFEICDERVNEWGKLIMISATGRPGMTSAYACP